MARRLTMMLAVFSCGALVFATVASAKPRPRTVSYRGYTVEVPRSWHVYNLAVDPSRCVRFDRHAVYLGTPSADQNCPAHAVGRSEAILIEPLDRRRIPSQSLGSGLPRAMQIPVPSAGVAVTATWKRDRAVVERIVHNARGAGVVRSPARGAGRAGLPHRPGGRATASSGDATASSVYYTGLGFDACSAPSVTTMSAWLASPYRAIGVYIGGVNRGCSQPNLSSTWVATEIAAGWVLIPTYVGLQAPSNSCGCAAIKPSQAAAQGALAADDAVVQAAALGIGPGNPIYFDMEGYARTATNTSAVLNFLGAWTVELHARGYVSGVYGSASSTIADLVGQYGFGFNEPDDIWIAHWNGLQTTDDPYVPASYWANHQRLHQYQGGHKESYGGISINIDNDYLDGAVVGSANQPLVRRRLRCRRVIFSHRPRAAAVKIRAFNLLRCGTARKVAAASEPTRFSPRGRARVYSKRSFTCRGHRVGRLRVVYSCVRRSAAIRFVRKG